VKISRTGRKKTSIWIDAFLWDWFVKWVHKNRTSTCHLLEPFIYALKQTEDKIQDNIGLQTPLPKIDLTLNLTREVQRHRRREDVGFGPVWNDWGDHLRCYFCKRPTKWIVYYSPGWDRSFRIWVCGFHRRRYLRIRSRPQGYPQIKIEALYRGERGQ